MPYAAENLPNHKPAVKLPPEKLESFCKWASGLTPDELDKLSNALWGVRQRQYAEWDKSSIIGNPEKRRKK